MGIGPNAKEQKGLQMLFRWSTTSKKPFVFEIQTISMRGSGEAKTMLWITEHNIKKMSNQH